MASPAFRSSTIPGSGSSAGITITKPTGVVDNDILVCFAYFESDAAITPPSGWTQKLLNEQNAGGEDHRLYCWWHRAASDGASYAWSWTGSVFRDFSIHAFSGALTSGDPFQQTNTAIAGASSATTPAVSLTTTTADTTLLWAGSNFNSNAWNTDPTGFTALYDASYGRCFYKAQATAGASGSITCTNNVAGFQTAMLLSLASIAEAGGGGTLSKRSPLASPIFNSIVIQ